VTPGRLPLARVSTTEAVVNELRSQILDGTLEPGTHLREIELSERFGVSRQSLRASLVELVHLGLLRREAHRGVWVATLTRRDIRDLYLMREILETEAVRRLAANRAAWPAVETAVGRLERLPARAPWSQVVDADIEIHHAIVEAVGSPRMTRAHGLLGTEMRLSVVPARRYVSRAAMIELHRELLDAIRTGDPDQAAARFREHLAFGSEDLLAALPEDTHENTPDGVG